MKHIILKNQNDLDLIKKVKKNEDMSIIVTDSFPLKMRAMNMHSYQGKIYMFFKSNNNKTYQILTDNISETQAFFKYLSKEQLEIRGNAQFYYRKKDGIKVLNTEQELIRMIKETSQNMRLKIEMKNDIVLHQNFPINLEMLDIKGAYHLYLPRSLMPENFYDEHIIFYDRYLKVKSVEDLYKLEDYKNGTIVVELKKDISDFSMTSISLANFVGDLYFLGNNHTISNGVISSNDDYMGLISTLHPYTNLYMQDLTLKNVRFIGAANYGGAFVGGRQLFDLPYQSPLGKVCLLNCEVSNIKLLDTNSSSPYFGLLDENMEIMNCKYRNVIAGNRVFIFSQPYHHSTLSIPGFFETVWLGDKSIYDEKVLKRIKR